MRYTKSGDSDLSVSRICLGCMGFGDAGNGQHSSTAGQGCRANIRPQAAWAKKLGIASNLNLIF